MLYDEGLAAIVRATGWGLDDVFLAAYVLSMLVVWAGLTLIGSRLYASGWATAALIAACTLRHRITRTSANSSEPYFHPRVLAFGCGLLAVAAILRGRRWLAVGVVALAAVVHVTTALWFAVLVGVAVFVLDTRWRTTVLPLGGLAAVALATAWAGGLLDGRLSTMDPVWLQAVATKDSLFAAQWPVSAWAANLGLLAVLWVAHRSRVQRGHATDADAAIVWGATALVAIFLVTLPVVTADVAFFVQLQIPRVFWLVDAVATIYVLAALVESGASLRTTHVRAVALAVALGTVAVTRGAYVMLVERPDRPLFATTLPHDDWQEAMAWIGRQPPSTHVLADPGHAWKFGTSVRVAAARDVLLEEVKDSALAIYSRDVAARVVERTAAVDDFSALTADRARELALRYDLDYLVTVADMPLPESYRNNRFRIYALGPSRPR